MILQNSNDRSQPKVATQVQLHQKHNISRQKSRFAENQDDDIHLPRMLFGALLPFLFFTQTLTNNQCLGIRPKPCYPYPFRVFLTHLIKLNYLCKTTKCQRNAFIKLSTTTTQTHKVATLFRLPWTNSTATTAHVVPPLNILLQI